MLDEECIVPKASDMTYAQKLNDTHLGKHPAFEKPKPPKGKQACIVNDNTSKQQTGRGALCVEALRRRRALQRQQLAGEEQGSAQRHRHRTSQSVNRQ